MKFFKIIKHNAKSIGVLVAIVFFTSIWALLLQGDLTLLPELLRDFWGKLSFSWAVWDKWITVLTFVMAGVIGWQGYTRRWENDLPNKITVHFMFNGYYIMSCYRAYLSGSDDSRAWGQQIGKQMASGQYLDIEPRVKQKEIEIIDNGFKHYEIIFYLYEEPKIFQSENLKNKYITWMVEDDSVSKRTHARRKHPLAFEQAFSQGEKLPEAPQVEEVNNDSETKQPKNDIKERDDSKTKKVIFYYSED